MQLNVIVGGATTSRAPSSDKYWEGASKEWWEGRRECQRQATLPLKVCVISSRQRVLVSLCPDRRETESQTNECNVAALLAEGWHLMHI